MIDDIMTKKGKEMLCPFVLSQFFPPPTKIPRCSFYFFIVVQQIVIENNQVQLTVLVSIFEEGVYLGIGA